MKTSRSSAAERKSDASAHRKKRILLVGGSPELYRALTQELDPERSTVTTMAESGDVPDNFAAIVFSGRTTSGMKFLKETRRFRPPPVFIFIEENEALDVVEAYDKGAEAVFTAHVSPPAVIRALEAAWRLRDRAGLRKFSRFPLAADVSINLPGTKDTWTVSVGNIGAGGMFLEMPTEPLPKPGNAVTFEIKIQDERFGTIKGVGTVQWTRPLLQASRPRGIGIEFIELSADARRAVILLINSMKTETKPRA